MAEYLSPGVYVEEFDSGSKPMEGVGTSTAGFVGLAERGPIEGLPQLVTNFSDFKRKYGGILNETFSYTSARSSYRTSNVNSQVLISFFGTGFTIMAFHNDISINRLFSRVYEQVMGYTPQGYTILEIAYSLGLTVGIIVFFNHIGGRRLTKDPTPIEVEMRVYETDVNKALIETADREGKTIDAS